MQSRLMQFGESIINFKVAKGVLLTAKGAIMPQVIVLDVH